MRREGGDAREIGERADGTCRRSNAGVQRHGSAFLKLSECRHHGSETGVAIIARRLHHNRRVNESARLGEVYFPAVAFRWISRLFVDCIDF
jgi:hypothetical protein